MPSPREAPIIGKAVRIFHAANGALDLMKVASYGSVRFGSQKGRPMLRNFFRFLWRTFGFIALMAFILIVLYLVLWPIPIRPEAWSPPKAPELKGQYEYNSYLEAANFVLKGVADGPEDVAIDQEGRIYGGMADGTIVRTGGDLTFPEIFAYTEGRPLGMDFDGEGNLIVADAIKGLLSIDLSGEVSVLTDNNKGEPFGFTDDVDVAPSGAIYFSDASIRFGYGKDYEDVMEHGANGRLFVYKPATKETRLLLSDLYFANGVAVAPDESFVLVNETSAYRVKKLWLAGPKAGQAEVLIDNLPGFPDGISSNGAGMYWVALFSPRVPTLDLTLPHPILRGMVYRLPGALRPAPKMYGFVLGINKDGAVLQNFQGPSGAFAPITSAEQDGNRLYLGSLTADRIAVVNLPE